MIEILKGWKTVIFNTIVIIAAALEAGTYDTVIPDQYKPYILGVIGIVNILLRANTNTPIARKD